MTFDLHFQSKKSIFFMGVLIWAMFACEIVLARPEFALRIGNNRCTNCHYSPAGGGPKNLNGKYYGAGTFKLSPFSAQPYAGAEVKYLYYSPDKHSQVRGGLAAMMGAVWASIPISEMAEGAIETRIVGEQNIGGFATSGPRNLYLLYSYKDEAKTSWLPQHYLLGRFIPPFGLMSDEHRTYVRMQTASTWNQDIRMGLMMSANPYEWFHYDIAALNGQRNDGTTYQNGQSAQWGYLGNLRFQPARWGALFGMSAAHYDADVGGGSRSARSVYTGFSFHRLTGDKVPVTLLAEYAEATNWNSSFSSTFIEDAAYATSIASTSSRGILGQLNWDVSKLIQLSYKYDRLVLDKDFPADHYQRHGFGLKHYFGPNMWLQMRYERATSSRPGEEAGAKAGGLNAFWAVVNASI